MGRFLEYYSLFVITLSVIGGIFFSEGDEGTFIGGIMLLPVVLVLWENIKREKKIEAENKKRKDILKEKRMKEEIKKEIKEENEQL